MNKNKIKRSDMIKDMACELIIVQCNIGKNPYNFDIAQDICEHLLNECEKRGMCPITVDQHNMLSSMDWEPENE